MLSFLTSRRKRSVFYKVFCVVIVFSCFLLWRRKVSLRSGGSKSAVDQLSDFSEKQKAGHRRSERSEDVQNINAIDDDALPVKSIPNYDVVGIPRPEAEKLKNDGDGVRNALGMSQNKNLEQYDSDINADIRKIVPGEFYLPFPSCAT